MCICLVFSNNWQSIWNRYSCIFVFRMGFFLLTGFPFFLTLHLPQVAFFWHTCIHSYISYLSVERSLLQPHIKSTIMIIIILKQIELWYGNSIGIGRYPNSGIGMGSEVKKCGSVHPEVKVGIWSPGAEETFAHDQVDAIGGCRHSCSSHGKFPQACIRSVPWPKTSPLLISVWLLFFVLCPVFSRFIIWSMDSHFQVSVFLHWRLL